MSKSTPIVPVSDFSTPKEASIYLFQDENFIEDVAGYILANDEEKDIILDRYEKNSIKAFKFIKSSSFPRFSEIISVIHFESMERIDYHNDQLRGNGDTSGYNPITKKTNMSYKMVQSRKLLVLAVENPQVFVNVMNDGITNEQYEQE